MKFSDIPQLTNSANYRVNTFWSYLKESLGHYMEDGRLAKLNIDPDFQRGHVWSEEQQIDYIEFKLRGGAGSNIIYFNCVGWMGSFKGPFVLVDGKQRINAVLRFLDNEIKAFGHYYSEFEGWMPSNCEFIFAINNLQTEKDVLQWYLEMNSGGTPHTKAELDKVRDMLNQKEPK